MICAWEPLMSVLPTWIRQEVDKTGRNKLQQLHLRIGQPPLLRMRDGCTGMNRIVKREDIQFCVNTATKYSPWAAQTIINGYITAPGGHRIGVCGETVVQNGVVTGFRDVRSLCIRVAGDYPGIARDIVNNDGSVLILGRPGCGKTTLLRDLIRQLSARETVGVVDQREELFPAIGGVSCFQTGERTDVVTGCDKAKGIEMLIRTMSPDTVATDEITANEDCDALINAAWCGVRLLATAHAGSKEDLLKRRVYRPLIESGIFTTLVILQRDKSWRMERITYDN
mgnify:CR=1 FL=1